MITLKLDYIAVRLTEEFDLASARSYLTSSIVDSETGEVQGPVISPEQWHAYQPTSSITTLSFFRGGERLGYELACKYNLPITRLDFALDRFFHFQEDAQDEVQMTARKVEQNFKRRHIEVPQHKWERPPKGDDGRLGYSFYSGSAPRYLRIYEKLPIEPLTEGLKGMARCRIEWQLRGDNARLAFEALKAGGIDDAKTLFDIHQSLTAEHLAEDLFELGAFEPVNVHVDKSAASVTGRQSWFYLTVLNAAVRYWKDEAFDILGDLHRLFLEQLKAEEEGRVQAVKSSVDKNMLRLGHIAREKLGIEGEGMRFAKSKFKPVPDVGLAYDPWAENPRPYVQEEPPPF